MDWGLFGGVAGGVGALAGLIAVLYTVWWNQRRTPQHAENRAVRKFMANLAMRAVLWEEVGLERPREASESIEEIRTHAATLVADVRSHQDEKAAAAIRDASREAGRAIREGRRQRGAPDGYNWFQDALNAYREEVRPPIEALCTRHGIDHDHWPRITTYTPGLPGEAVEVVVIPTPSSDQP